MSLDDIQNKARQGINAATELGRDAKEMLLGYVEYARTNETVKSFEDYSREYAAKAAAGGRAIANDAIDTSKHFLTTTDTGKSISSWAGKTWDAISKNAAIVGDKISETANNVDQQSGGFFSKNRAGVLSGILGLVATTFLTGNPLLGLIAGLVGGAAIGYFNDPESSAKAMLAKSPEPTPKATPEQPATVSTPSNEPELGYLQSPTMQKAETPSVGNGRS